MSTPDDGTITYNYSQCNEVYEELFKDQATIAAQIESLKQTINGLMSTWTGMSADQWQSIQTQWNAAIETMASDLNTAANCLPEMAGNMQYADKSAAIRISSNTLTRLFEQPPSVPSPTRTPRATRSTRSVTPSPRNMFEPGQ